MTAQNTATETATTTQPSLPSLPDKPLASITGRLGPGELRRYIARYLAAHPGWHTVNEVVFGLGARYRTTIRNGLDALTDQGYAEKRTAEPDTYRANADTIGQVFEQASASKGSKGRSERLAAAAAAKAEAAERAVIENAARRLNLLQQPVNGPVVRPNGQDYHPRNLAGLADVTALRKLREAAVPVLLWGPPGTGKTSLIEAAFPDLITVAGDGDTTVADFVGEYVQRPGGGYEFVYGPLIRAMQEGRALLVDDATLISPKVLAALYPAMDGRCEIVVKAHKGEVIKAAPGFYVVAGHNPGVHGAILTEALSSRFSVQVQVGSDYELAAKLKINPKVVKVAKNLATRQEKGEVSWAPQLRELIAFQKVVGVLGLEAAVSNLVGIAPEEDRAAVAEVVQDVFGMSFTPLTLGKQVPSQV